MMTTILLVLCLIFNVILLNKLQARKSELKARMSELEENRVELFSCRKAFKDLLLNYRGRRRNASSNN